MNDDRTELEDQIGQWRGYIQRHRAISPADVAEMEDHLRDQIDELTGTGLDEDESFLVAVKRMGSADEISREFAREHSERLWKQLVLTGPTHTDPAGTWRELSAVIAFAAAAAVTLRCAIWLTTGDDATFSRNIPLFVFPFVTGFFAWKRRSVKAGVAAAAAFVVGGLAVNLYPFDHTLGDFSTTETLAVTHLPIALWMAVGVAYTGTEWRSAQRRMDFIRFTGEWVVYFALLALGGGVLVGLTAGTLEAFEINSEVPMVQWVVPMGAAGATVVAAWLVEAKQSVVENIAPVLTRVFTPLTVIMLAVVLVIFLARLDLADVDRSLLLLMDLILVLVLGLVLYSISARDPGAEAGWFDRLQLVLLGVALAVDAVLLVTMLTRIADAGFTANKVAALGLNLVLLINLIWSTRLLAGFSRGGTPFSSLERWQTSYLPVYAVWAAFVVLVLPLIFRFA